MKKAILLIVFILSAYFSNAQEDYEKLWLDVERIEINNLPKSANKKVEAIYKKAVQENNSPQIVKCLFYKSKFSLILEEDATLKVINDFKTQIDKSSFPTKNVLQNILANLYWQYFQTNRYKFYQRTNTDSKVDVNDFRTWDLDTLFEEIHKYYDSSLSNSTQLQEIEISSFSDILKLEENSKIIQPTLFDFLANNALIFYKTPENSITKPAYQFKLNDTNYLKEASSFKTITLSSKDTISLQFKALKVYQKLIQFHHKKQNLKALATIDIKRFRNYSTRNFKS